jgi:hypothetical protein
MKWWIRHFSVLRGTGFADRFLAYILLSGAVPGPTGAALLFSWLGLRRFGVKAGSPFFDRATNAYLALF